MFCLQHNESRIEALPRKELFKSPPELVLLVQAKTYEFVYNLLTSVIEGEEDISSFVGDPYALKIIQMLNANPVGQYGNINVEPGFFHKVVELIRKTRLSDENRNSISNESLIPMLKKYTEDNTGCLGIVTFPHADC